MDALRAQMPRAASRDLQLSLAPDIELYIGLLNIALVENSARKKAGYDTFLLARSVDRVARPVPVALSVRAKARRRRLGWLQRRGRRAWRARRVCDRRRLRASVSGLRNSGLRRRPVRARAHAQRRRLRRWSVLYRPPSLRRPRRVWPGQV